MASPTPENKMGKSLFSRQEVLHRFYLCTSIIFSLKQDGLVHMADQKKFQIRFKEKMAYFGIVK